LGGCVLLVVVAALVDWFKGTPWAPKRQAPRQPVQGLSAPGIEPHVAPMSATTV
jgi:hypothetical protein